MTKSLSSYPEERRKAIAERRLLAGTMGAGYWAARGYYDKKKLTYPGKAGVLQQVAKVIAVGVQDARGYHMPEAGDDRPVKPQRLKPSRSIDGDRVKRGPKRGNKLNVPHKNNMRRAGSIR